MLEQLRVTNLPNETEFDAVNDKLFVLKTCQRTLLIDGSNSHNIRYLQGEHHHGEMAYTFLLQVICGLKSKLLGENEIVRQFKVSYQEYISGDQICKKTLLILEKLFKDAKDIRTNYLIGIGQKTYSSIARKNIYNKHKASKVLILGSGQLAEDLINQFKKKTEVFISARNDQKVKELIKKHDIKSIPWKDFTTYSGFAFIVNSIGSSKGTFIQDEFFTPWQNNHSNKLFIDLGSPSIIETSLSLSDGVMRLDDVFKEGAMQEEEKQRKIQQAENALKEIVIKRKTCLNRKSKNNYARNI